MKNSLRVAGLFAGIGGLELGLERAGHRTSFLCEKDEAARRVLGDHFSRRIFDDVRTLGGNDLPRSLDLLAAGFPCQDLSQCGATQGLRGSESSLVGHVFRILQERRVPWILLENVPFMLHLNRGRAMTRITDELEAMGYRWAYRVLDAQAFGLPQRRERVFLLASLDERPECRLLSHAGQRAEPSAWHDEASAYGFYWTEGNRGIGWARDAIPTLKGGSGLGIPSPPAVWLTDSGEFVKPTIESAERLQGFPRHWTASGHGTRGKGARWKLVGNAVAVPVAKWVGDRIASADERAPVGTPIRLTKKDKWPRAAFGGPNGRYAVPDATAWPKTRYKWSPIVDYMGGAHEPLSHRAAEGFRSRVVSAKSLNPNAEFVEALTSYTNRCLD